jgi:hypothetical protein
MCHICHIYKSTLFLYASVPCRYVSIFLYNSAFERVFNSLIFLGLRVIGGLDSIDESGDDAFDRDLEDEGIDEGLEGDFDIVDRGFEEGATFTGLSKIVGCAEDFFLAGTEVGGTETEAGVTLAVETFGIVGIVGIAEAAGAGTVTGIGIAFGLEAFSCAWLNKESL